MAQPVGDLDTQLRAIEAYVLEFVPRCTFFFGEKEVVCLQKSPPYVNWIPLRGVPDGDTRETATIDQRPFVDDQVSLVALCAGLCVPPQMNSIDLRRQQFAASMSVLLAVRWAVKRLRQGYESDSGWEATHPELLADAHYSLRWTFAVRAQAMTPPDDMTQPNGMPATLDLENP